jgi:hypothetical protein
MPKGGHMGHQVIDNKRPKIGLKSIKIAFEIARM